MKNKALIIASISLVLCSCQEREGNRIEAGIFVGKSADDKYELTLSLERVKLPEYEEAEGINVVKDADNGALFRLSFTANNKEGDFLTYTFNNLIEDSYDWHFYSYSDSNGATLTPWGPTCPFSTGLDHTYYFVSLDIGNIDIRANLYWLE